MKRKIYTALSVVVIGSLLWLLFTIHIPFDWRPTLNHDSKQPFGAALFDSLMSRSLPGGYEVLPDLPDTLDQSQNAVLYCKFSLGAYSRGYDNHDDEAKRAKKIMKFVRQGGQVIVATTYINHPSWYGDEEDEIVKEYDLRYNRNRIVTVEGNKVTEQYRIVPKDETEEIDSDTDDGGVVLDTIDVVLDDSSESLYRSTEFMYAVQPLIERMKKGAVSNDTVTWVDGKTRYLLSPLYAQGTELYNLCTTEHEVLLTYNFEHWHKEALAFRRRYKEGGSITFVAMPLLFSNYAVMDPEALGLTQRLLSPLQDKHLIRIVGQNQPEEIKLVANKDEFSFIRRHRSLRYAFYLLLATLILAFVNYSRRRMRAIPLQPEEKNVTLDFARFMGTFHYRRHDYKQVVLNQYDAMLHQLGETMVSDVNRLNTTELKEVIVEKTHLPAADVGMLVRTVFKLQNTDETINQEDMMKLLDVIRRIEAEL